MIKVQMWIVMIIITCVLGGCATVGNKTLTNADQTTQVFFDQLQRSNKQGAYNLFTKGLSQEISFSQWDQLIESIQSQWGSIESEETTLMPFHKREGEQNFIPLDVNADQIKRYIFDVKFERAEINCDLTLVPEGDQYKIAWISFWGSTIYFTPEIREKIEQLFSNKHSEDQ